MEFEPVTTELLKHYPNAVCCPIDDLLEGDLQGRAWRVAEKGKSAVRAILRQEIEHGLWLADIFEFGAPKRKCIAKVSVANLIEEMENPHKKPVYPSIANATSGINNPQWGYVKPFITSAVQPIAKWQPDKSSGSTYIGQKSITKGYAVVREGEMIYTARIQAAQHPFYAGEILIYDGVDTLPAENRNTYWTSAAMIGAFTDIEDALDAMEKASEGDLP